MTMIARSLQRAREARRRFADDKTGATAVEFALVAAPFFFMMFAVLEVAMIFFVGTVLENATTEAAREIRTGRFQAAGGGAEEFRQEVCDRAGFIIDCDKLTVDVRTYDDFAAADLTDPIDDEGEVDDEDFGFDTGDERDIVLVRVFYEWDVVTPLLGIGFSNLADNRRLLTAATAFRNEPFGG